MKTQLSSSAALILCLAATAADAQPAITASPGSNHPSSSTNVSGTTFGDNEAVDIYFDTTDEQLAVTNASGAFASTAIPVSASALPGTHWVTAIGRHSGLAAQAKFTVATNWTQFHYGIQQKGWNPYENVLSPSTVSSLDVAWTFVYSQSLSSPSVSGSTLYIGCGYLCAINATSGAVLWRGITTGGTVVPTGAPAVAGSLVYVGTTTGDVDAFKTSNGSIAWSVSTGSAISGNPVVANGTLYVVNGNGLYAYNAATGAAQWSFADKSLTIPVPAVANGLAFTGDSGPGIYALNASGDTIDSGIKAGSAIGQMQVAGNRVYVGCNCNTSAYLNPTAFGFGVSSGNNTWSYSDLGSSTPGIMETAAVANGIIYTVDADGYLSAVDAAGNLIWSAYDSGDGTQSVSVANGVVYEGNIYGLTAHNAQTGALLWVADDNTADAIGAPVIVNGMLYVAEGNNTLYAYALNAGNNGVYHRNPKPPALTSLRPNLSLSPWHRAKLPAEEE